MSPEYALGELQSHRMEVQERWGLSTAEMDRKMLELRIRVRFIPPIGYLHCLHDAFNALMGAGSVKNVIEDVDFIALALAIRSPLWSNDRMLQKQEFVPILTTADIARLR